MLDKWHMTKREHNVTMESCKSILKIGSYIKLGKYTQSSNDCIKDDIEWLILDVQGNEALIISKYALDCKKYHSCTAPVSWMDCTIREWLNVDFFNIAFSDFEKNAIISTQTTVEKKENFNEIRKHATNDKVFLLSTDEVNNYFTSDSARQCRPTNYTTTQGAFANDSTGYCWWWLRSQGDNQYDASYVYTSGYICKHGHNVRDDFTCVRPALWLDLNSYFCHTN